MTVPTDLDARFRDAAAASGLLDVATATHDTPLGTLFLAATGAGLCKVSFDAGARDEEEERLARAFGARVLRSPRPLDPVRRELDDYFEGRRRSFDIALDLHRVGAFTRDVLAQLAQVPYGRTTTYGTLAVRSGRPRAARAVGTVMNRNPIPIILPCHRVVGSTGSLVGYGGGLERKEALLRLEGVALAG